MTNYSHLTDYQHDILKEVASIGANHAINPMAKLIQEKVTIIAPDLQIVQVETIAELVGAANAVNTVVMIKIEGEANGIILLSLSQDDAKHLVAGIAPGLEASALEEVSNIFAGAALGALAKFLDMKLLQSVPGSATDMLQAIMNEVMAGLGAHSDHVLAIKIGFTVPSSNVNGAVCFLFDPTSTDKILRASAAKAEALGGNSH